MIVLIILIQVFLVRIRTSSKTHADPGVKGKKFPYFFSILYDDLKHKSFLQVQKLCCKQLPINAYMMSKFNSDMNARKKKMRIN